MPRTANEQRFLSCVATRLRKDLVVAQQDFCREFRDDLSSDGSVDDLHVEIRVRRRTIGEPRHPAAAGSISQKVQTYIISAVNQFPAVFEDIRVEGRHGSPGVSPDIVRLLHGLCEY